MAFVIDVFSRRIVGWKAARTMHAALVVGALNMAAWTRRGTGLDGLICHNDAGSQYMSIAHTDRLAELDAQASIGTVGDSYDCDDAGVGVSAGLTLAMTDRRVLALTCRPAGASTLVAC